MKVESLIPENCIGINLSSDIHLYRKPTRTDCIEFKFISSIDELLNTHPIYKNVYSWLIDNYGHNYWDPLEYTQIINQSFFYFVNFSLFKHPEIEWPDIKRDFEPLVIEDVRGEVDKSNAIMEIIVALLTLYSHRFEFFSKCFIQYMLPHKPLVSKLLKSIVKSIQENTMPPLKILLNLDVDCTKRFLKTHGAFGCCFIQVNYGNTESPDELERHFDNAIKSIFNDCKNDNELTKYYFGKLGYAVLKTKEGYMYDITFRDGCKMDKYIASFEDGKTTRLIRNVEKLGQPNLYIESRKARRAKVQQDRSSVFSSKEADVYWNRLVKLGILMPNRQLTTKLSHNDAAYIALMFNKKLRPDQSRIWGYFEQLWNKSGFRSAGCTKGDFPRHTQEIDLAFK